MKLFTSAAAVPLTLSFIATPAQAEPSQCWATPVNAPARSHLAPHYCDVTFLNDGDPRFAVRIWNTRWIVRFDFDHEVALVTFEDGEVLYYDLSFDDEYDVRMSGKGDYQFAFRLPRDFRQALIHEIESDLAPPASLRGTLSDTPFRF